MLANITKTLRVTVMTMLLAMGLVFTAPALAYAAPHVCGSGETEYTPSIELNCVGRGNGILDLTFAIIRFLSYGVGLIIIGSLTYAGVQYTGSRGDPNATALAVKRIQANVAALLFFVFGFALLNYLVPGALLK